MKKQFLRVKQLADQTFSRAGKTEALSDDLQDADRRVELIRNACQNTSKKMTSTLLAQGQDVASKEKRLKKSVEYTVGLSMVECEKDDDSLLGAVINDCGRLQIALANEFVEYESLVEEKVVTPLQAVVEDASIIKLKQKLNKAVLDMDSARGRLQAAMKHNAGQPLTAKVDSVREEFEDAELKMEQCRDTLAIEMYQLLSKEAELAATIVDYVQIQRAYHEKAIKVLDTFIPDLEAVVQESPIRPVFGAPLEEHLKVTGRQIALPIEMCVCALIEQGMEEEGLFRIAGSASRVRRLKLGFDAGCLTHETILHLRDPHVVGGVLKSYLRELPEPLMTHSLYLDWMSTLREQGSTDDRLKALWTVVHKLPVANRENLRYLIKFLSLLCRNQERNKMSPQNVAIVIAPNLIWSPQQDVSNPGLNMNTSNLYNIIVENLVSYADYFFPEEIDFYVTLSQEHAKEILSTMASMISSNAVTITAPLANSGPQRHARNGSGDSQLVESTMPMGDMQRAQSTGSLSDQCGSPPHGSPKPVTRRKNKPAAPVPPVVHASDHAHPTASTTATSATPHKGERPGKPPPPVSNAISNAISNSVPTVTPASRSSEKPTKPPPPVILQEKIYANVSASIACPAKPPANQNPPKETGPPVQNDKPVCFSTILKNETENEDQTVSARSAPSAIGFEQFMSHNVHQTHAPAANVTVTPVPAPTSATLQTGKVAQGLPAPQTSNAVATSTTTQVVNITPSIAANNVANCEVPPEKLPNDNRSSSIATGVATPSQRTTPPGSAFSTPSTAVSTSTLERKKPQRPTPVAAPRTTLLKAAEAQNRGKTEHRPKPETMTVASCPSDQQLMSPTLLPTTPRPSSVPPPPPSPATLASPASPTSPVSPTSTTHFSSHFRNRSTGLPSTDESFKKIQRPTAPPREPPPPPPPPPTPPSVSPRKSLLNYFTEDTPL